MIFTKLKLAVAAAVTALALAVGAVLVWQYRAIDRLQIEAHAASQRATVAEAQVLAERRAVVAHTTARRKAEAKLKASDDALDKALAAVPEWADQPVPPGIDDWLRDHIYDDPAQPDPGLPVPGTPAGADQP